MFLLAKLKILFVFLSLFSPLQLLLYPPLTGELSRGNPPPPPSFLICFRTVSKSVAPKGEIPPSLNKTSLSCE